MTTIQSVNEEHRVKSGNKLFVGSLYVKALYPSLNIPYAAEKMCEEFIESEIEFVKKYIDTYELGLYLELIVSS